MLSKLKKNLEAIDNNLNHKVNKHLENKKS